jgi:signal transduction histidine kinase
MITDTGHGIGDDIISQVFDPFFTTKEIGMGTGLGLSISYNIIKQHGGEISIVSSEQGGTIITTTFPVITDE